GALVRIKSTIASLRTIETVFPAAKDLCDRLDTSFIEIKDIAREISGELENIEFDPSELERINEQLNRIYTLEHKYHVNEISQILAIKDDLARQLHYISNSDEELDGLRRQLDDAQKNCEQKAQAISALRADAARKVERETKHYLEALGIPNVRFSVDISRKPLSRDGMDKIIFLFSANKSSAMQPISQVASGGEIARVMLALKAMISGTVKLPTIIFDEIDIGVSGRIAEQMAGIMKEMGDEGRQVISITHLPQIAASGATHYKVEKEETDQGTISRMHLLTTEERVTEIAQMLSGSQISNEAISNAKVLLKLNA
ncbi:MAG: DNA repair protein RecN, partial [Prevotella sp.]|nr:DNA repair protein RecN [Prevotella sp.]